MPADIASLRAAYVAQVHNHVSWIATVPSEAWDSPSRLPAWTVGQLSFHTTEVPNTVIAALLEDATKDKATENASTENDGKAVGAELGRALRSAAS